MFSIVPVTQSRPAALEVGMKPFKNYNACKEGKKHMPEAAMVEELKESFNGGNTNSNSSMSERLHS